MLIQIPRKDPRWAKLHGHLSLRNTLYQERIEGTEEHKPGAWKLRHRGNMLIPTRVRTRVQDLLTVGGNRAYKSLKLSGQWDVYSERVILSKKFELLKFLGLPT